MGRGRALRWLCAASIATGGVMHLAGLHAASTGGFAGPWWMYAIFWTAIVGYPASAVGILLDRKPAYLFAVAGPIVGGILIFLGLLSNDLDFQILIPGTLSGEITPIGFVTLVVEPLAVLSALLVLTE